MKGPRMRVHPAVLAALAGLLAAGCGTEPEVPALLALSLPEVEFVAPAGGSAPATQTVQVSNDGGSALTDLTARVRYALEMPTGWLSASLSTGTAPAVLTIGVAPGALPAGTYRGDVVVESPVAENGPQVLDVTFTLILPAPSDLAVTEISSSAARLTWSDNSATETGFRIERCSGAGCTAFAALAEVAAGVTAYDATGLDAGGLYVFRVRAYQGGSVSEPSNAVPVNPPTLPLAPSDLDATVVSSTEIHLTWADNASDETGYGVYRCAGATCEPTGYLSWDIPNLREFTDRGLTPGTTYRYRVWVHKSGAGSALSDIVTAATYGPPARLAFLVQPSRTHGNETIAPQVEVAVQDNAGNTLPDGNLIVTIAIGDNAGGGTLSGVKTVQASRGVARFTDLRIDLAGAGYTLVATSGTLTQAKSDPVDIYLTFGSISVGRFHTCGLTSYNSAYCWGDNLHGQLGDGTATDRNIPVPVGGALRFVKLRAGEHHNCAITSTGASYCWGWNGNGQLGDGSFTNRRTPTLIPGMTFYVIEPGGQHTCGFTAAGVGYCWGANSFGQLGDDAGAVGVNESSPVAMAGGYRFSAMSAGTHHTCGRITTGRIVCWGVNTYGQIGDNSTTNRLAPVAVSGDRSFADVGTGVLHSCGLQADGVAYCWGYNFFGQLGDGTTVNRWLPTIVLTQTRFGFLGEGGSHNCGIDNTTARAGFCWGFNTHGQLGIGTQAEPATPTEVSGTQSWASISGRDFHTCALTPEQAAYCWGRNDAGQLGDATLTPRTTPTRVRQ